MIKLIACDIDGTLLQNGVRSIQPEMITYIKELKRKGILFVAASGRQYPNLRRLFEPVKDDIAYICENGALTIYKKEVLQKRTLKRDLGKEILTSIMEKEGAEVLLSGVHTCYLEPKNLSFVHHMEEVVGNVVTVEDDIFKVTEPYLKISVYEEDGIEKIQDYWIDLFKDRVSIAVSGNCWLDMIPFHCNKKTALEVLGQKFFIEPDQMMAFGDQHNDIEMLEYVGQSYAMKSGRSLVKQVSKYETDRVEPILLEFLKGGNND